MKIFLININLLLLVSTQLWAQKLEVIGSAGENATGSSINISYTVGECITVPFEGATETIVTGFHQGEECLAQNATGQISGCQFLCPGDLDHSYTYDVSGYIRLTGHQWAVTPANAATILNSDENSIELEFPDPSITSVDLRFTPFDECGAAPPVDFEIELDPACVWPGDIDNDGQVTLNDWNALNEAFAKYCDAYCADPSIPGHPARVASCVADTSFNWEGYYSSDWDAISNFNTTNGLINGKYADADGDGEINPTGTATYIDLTVPLTELGDPTDADVFAHHYELGYTHNGNTHRQNVAATGIINITPVKVVVEHGETIQIIVSMGSTAEPIYNVRSVAFTMETTMDLPSSFIYSDVNYDSTHFDMLPWQRFIVGYQVLKTDSTNYHSLHGFGTKRDNDTRDFAGEELLRYVCDIPVAGYEASSSSTNRSMTSDTISAVFSITEAAYRNEDYYDLNTTSTTVLIVNPLVLKLTALLEGNFVDSLMSDDLRSQGLIPLEEPYTALGYEPTDGGQTIDPAILSVTDSNAVVDWVFLELRDKDDFSTTVYSRACLLQRDGNIVDTDGESPVKLKEVADDDYYLVLKHRSHLQAKSAGLVSHRRGQFVEYDFSNQGTNFLISGNSNADCFIDAEDRNDAWNTRNQSGYLSTDFNLDGLVDSEDRSIVWNNRNTQCDN